MSPGVGRRPREGAGPDGLLGEEAQTCPFGLMAPGSSIPLCACLSYPGQAPGQLTSGGASLVLAVPSHQVHISGRCLDSLRPLSWGSPLGLSAVGPRRGTSRSQDHPQGHEACSLERPTRKEGQ